VSDEGNHSVCMNIKRSHDYKAHATKDKVRRRVLGMFVFFAILSDFITYTYFIYIKIYTYFIYKNMLLSKKCSRILVFGLTLNLILHGTVEDKKYREEKGNIIK
jgi:hypothetical protein